MKKTQLINSIKIFFAGGLVWVPFLVGADLVICDGPKCHFGDLITLVDSVLDYILAISASLAAIMFSYAGFLYLTAQGETGKRTKANQVFVNVGKGLFFVVAAWLIVKAVLLGLGTKVGYYLLDL